MTIMRKLFAIAALLGLAGPLAATEFHQATPLPQFMMRLGLHYHGEAVSEPETNVRVVAGVEATTRTFNIVARRFAYDFNPSPFVVNQGDTVVINISVPSTDGSPRGHGFAMELYSENFLTIAKGTTRTITFVADTPGTFTYFCTQSDCGTDHDKMNGVFTVNAVAPSPVLTSISPASAPVTGGTTVTFNGANFTAGAVVKFNNTTATGVTLVNSSQITAVVPPASGSGPVTVTITFPSGESLSGTFTYTGPVPPKRRAAKH